MTTLTNPHDHFFKAVFSEPALAEDFLAHHLPAEVLSLLDLARLEIRKDSFIDPALTEHRSDLLYAVPLASGEPSYVYVLFEHKSHPEPDIALDLLRYMMRIWEQWRREHPTGLLPVIVPLVLYHGPERWNAATRFAASLQAPPALAPYLPDFGYQLTDLSRYRDEEIKGAVWQRVALLALKHIFQPDLEPRLRDILSLVRDLAHQPTGLDYLYTLLRYISAAAPHLKPEELHAAVVECFTQGDTIMPTIAERWVQQGEAQVLRRLLIRRFGPLPDWTEERLAHADITQLEAWADRMLDADTLEAVFL
jgi:predicted transposase/invertase (TIGR01784 family)